MTAMAILRTQKVKGRGQVSAMAGHHNRTRETPNADPDAPAPYFVLGSGNPEADINRRYQEAGVTRRKNGVDALELLCTASPEWFETGDTGDFVDSTLKWAKNYFGENNIVSAVVHRDESTPHLHIAVTPIKEKENGKKIQSAKHWIDGRQKLSAMQDSYASAVEELGLERGIKGSKATHRRISQYYANVNKALDELNNFKVETPPRSLSKNKLKSWSKEQTKQLANTAKQVYIKATHADLAESQKKEYQQTASQLSKENEQLKTDYKQLAGQVRDIPLTDVAERLGLHQKTGVSNPNWTDANDDLEIQITGQKFYDFYAKTGAGGAIDLTKHVLNCDFKEAVVWLSENFNKQAVESAVRSQAQEYVEEAKATAKSPFKLPQEADTRAWNKVRDYLVQERKLSANMVDKLHEQGDIYASEYNGYTNAVFVNKQRTSAEIRGVDAKFRGIQPGSNIDQGGMRVQKQKSPKKLVVTESAIDTISYSELHDENFLAISAIGARHEVPYIQKALNNGWEVVCAYDNDKQGEEGFEKLQEQYTGIEREKPVYGDWNQDLQAYIKQGGLYLTMQSKSDFTQKYEKAMNQSRKENPLVERDLKQLQEEAFERLQDLEYKLENSGENKRLEEEFEWWNQKFDNIDNMLQKMEKEKEQKQPQPGKQQQDDDQGMDMGM